MQSIDWLERLVSEMTCLLGLCRAWRKAGKRQR